MPSTPNPVSKEYLLSNTYRIGLPEDCIFNNVLGLSPSDPRLIYVQISRLEEGNEERYLAVYQLKETYGLTEMKYSLFWLTPMKTRQVSFYDDHLMADDKFIELSPETN